MTQPEMAVGGSDDPIIAAEPTLEDRFAAISDEQVEEPETEAAEAPEANAEPDLTPDDVPEEASEDAEQADEPPIKPPVSWTAEEQEEFKGLPRALQETLTRRESEREKFVQSKAQEAKQARAAVEREATAALQQLQDNYAAQVQSLLPPIPERPTHQQLAEDPWTYGPQMDAYENAVAQHQWAQQQLHSLQTQRGQAEQAARQQALLQEQEALQDALPEWFDPVEGPKLHAEMKSIAHDLGYSAEQLNDATASEILALQKISHLKAKADKYDTLMKDKMERVRAAKELPKVSKPGVPQGKGAVANQRYTADRHAMQKGDTDAAKRVFSQFL